MLIYVLAGIALLLLLILFRYLPRRIFFIFALLLAVLGGGIFQLRTAGRETPPPTEEQIAARSRDQAFFTQWWSAYQKDIAELDRCWTRYHQILTDAKKGDVALKTTYVRLAELERDMQDVRARMGKNAPATEMSDELYDLIAVMISKTGAYAEAEQKAVTLTRAAADPAAMQEKNPAEQARLLELVMLRTAPVALFIEDEIGAARRYLAPASAARRDKESAAVAEDEAP